MKISNQPISLNSSIKREEPIVLFEESKKAYIRKAESDYYGKKLKESEKRIEENKKKRKVIKPESMPWEKSRHGILKHLFNERMDIPIESIDAYMQFIPPGSRSGKHRHMSEEYIFVLEGKGYDLHWDVDFELGEKYYWKVNEKAQSLGMGARRFHLHPSKYGASTFQFRS